MERGLRKTRVGIVISDRMNKTIKVKCERVVRHPKYGKYIRQTAVYFAHDETNQAKVGDRVEIKETRPLSKTKRWRLVKVIKKIQGEQTL